MPTPQCQLAIKMRTQTCVGFAQHQLHHAVFDSSPSGLTVLDAEGRIVESNPAAKRILGRTALDGCAYNESEWLIRDLEGKPVSTDELPFEIVRRTGKPVSNVRHSVRTAEGEVVYLSISGQPLFDDSNTFGGAIFSVTDITAEILAQKEIAETQQRYELAILGTGLGMWDWHVPSGRVVINETWATMLGYRLEEIAPHVDAWASIVHPSDTAMVNARIQEHFAGLTENYECEHRVRAKSGEYRWILDRGRVITRDEYGVPIRMVGTHQDTTDRRRAEEELRRAKDAAEAANRAKGEFLANISHEIRTPMNAILGFADVLRDPTLTADERNDHIATIRRNGEHLMSLLNDVLDLSKIEAGALTVEHLRVSPVSIIQDTAALMRLRCESKGLAFHVRVACDLPVSILADPTRLRQILLNLLGNAIKFTHTGSVTLDCRCDAGVLAIRVIDTGIGISPEDRERLFLPFTQADMTVTRRFGGTGLGLTISRRLASLMGGEISVESRVGVGSTFTLTLPLETSSEADTALAANADWGDALHLVGRRVLIVDDAPDNQLLLRYLLSRRGIDCELASDGDVAIRQAGASAFDAILMDMQMPVLDGYSATRALRRAGVTVPIIALTANALAGDEQRCRDAGCDFHLTKPVHASRLIQTLAQAIYPVAQAVSPVAQVNVQADV